MKKLIAWLRDVTRGVTLNFDDLTPPVPAPRARPVTRRRTAKSAARKARKEKR